MTTGPTTPEDPVDTMLTMARAYAAFADQQPGFFDVMFQRSMIRDDDSEYLMHSGAAFEALQAVVADCQARHWHDEDDTRTLATAAWSLANGITVLRRHGSLVRHFPGDSLEAVATIASTLASTRSSTTWHTEQIP